MEDTAAIGNTSNANDIRDARANKLNQHVGSLIASLGGFAFGISLGWNSSASYVLRNVSSASSFEIGLIGCMLNLGALLGSVAVPILVKILGRVITVYLTMTINFLGWTLICLSKQTMAPLMIGRLLCGVSGGVFCIITPFYIAEIAHCDIRERLLTFYHLMINSGIAYAFLLDYLLKERDDIWKYSLYCALPCLSMGVIHALPQSPLYYIKKKDYASAKRSLVWYRGERFNVEDELEELKRHSNRLKKVTFALVCNARVMRSLASSVIVMVTQQLCGVHTMIFYALTLFNSGGSGNLTGSEQTLAVGVTQTLSCILAAILIGALGRRILLTVSSALMGLFLIMIGWYFQAREADPEIDDTHPWLPPTSIGLFFAAFNLGIGPISWSMLADTFPAEIRTLAASLVASTNWLLAILSSTMFVQMVGALGISRTLWSFAAFCFAGAILCAALCKDTSGKTLARIQQDFFPVEGSRPEASRPTEETKF
ncbi:facilitated trehalose transporter Tret1-like [Prorops nasuta]|uniref:facilitated trehalose transporter Tret1-like n=1 Tax=Prorops nasuta TaxID=863751 RepID=UPI0034CD26B8